MIRLILDRDSLDDHLLRWESDRVLGVLIAMKRADPILDPSELSRRSTSSLFFRYSVRSDGPRAAAA